MAKGSLAKDSIYNVLYKAMNILFPLITSIYIARILEADSIGKVAAAQNIASYFTLAAAMGIPTYGVKVIAQHELKSWESSKAFSELFAINGIFSIICSIAYYILVLNSSYFADRQAIYCVAGINVIFNIINVDWFYQGIREYGYIAARSFCVKCLSLVALVLLVRSPKDYIVYALISSSALVVNYIFNIIHLRRYVRFCIKGIKLKKHIRPIIVLFVGTVAIEVYTLADTTMLDVMTTTVIVGYYTMSTRIIKVIRSMVAAISAVFLPKLSYFYYNGQYEEFRKLANKGIHVLLVLAIPAALGIFMVAEDAVLVCFGAEFANSVMTIRILSISILTVAISNFIGMQILVTLRKEQITTISTVCGAVTNIVLNYFCIRRFAHNGAAAASVVTEATVMMVQLVLCRKYIRLKFGLFKPLAAAGCMCVGVYLIRMIPVVLPVRLLLSVGGGALIYCLASLALHDDFVMTVYSRIVGKLRGMFCKSA